MTPRTRSSRGYKYDVALSFAGEDRKHAESLFRLLTQRGLAVFYDEDRQAYLWGKSSVALARIYGPETRYVIPFVSKHYVRKDWTLYEFDTARREQKKRRAEFILPVRLDDSRLLGLNDDVIRLDARKTSVEHIAQLFAEKCGRLGRRAVPPATRGVRTIALGLLKHDAQRALGLIATAAVPMPLTYFGTLFPKYEWHRLVRNFRRAELLQPDGDLLSLNPAALRAVLGNVEERTANNDAWINRLRPLQDHVDAAAFLSLHLVSARRFEDAARVALNIAQHSNLGWWNQIYTSLLRGLARRRAFSTLPNPIQLELLNSLGTCLSGSGHYREALTRLEHLRRLSTSHRSSWGLGQSYINSGVVAHRQGDTERAETSYTRAVAHARRFRDHMLLGRALSNLAQLYQQKDIEKAELLLEQSLRAKAAAHDSSGLAVGMAVRGSFAASRGDFARAARCYQESTRAAARLGLRYEQAMSIYNHGRALQDMGRLRAARRLYAKARLLSAADDYTDLLLLSLRALGAVAFQTNEYARAQECSKELLVVAKRAKHQEYVLEATHMLAVSLVARGKASEGAATFRVAIKEARARHEHE